MIGMNRIDYMWQRMMTIRIREQGITSKLCMIILLSIVCATTVNAFQTPYNNLVDNLVLPRDTEINWVGRDLVQNGHRMQILSFRSRLSSNEIIEFFNTYWSDFSNNSLVRSPDDSNVVLSTVGSWKTIGVLDTDRQIVVQVQRASSSNINRDSGFISTGFISSMELQTQSAYTRVPFSHPHGSVLLSTTHSNDSDKDTAYTGFEATTSVVMVPGTVDGIAAFYKSHMTRNGWVLQTDHSTKISGAQMYTRTGETSEISFNRQSYNQVIVTLNRLSKRSSQ